MKAAPNFKNWRRSIARSEESEFLDGFIDTGFLLVQPLLDLDSSPNFLMISNLISLMWKISPSGFFPTTPTYAF
jgi:hypothetical protein